jgi:hypothetical protein
VEPRKEEEDLKLRERTTTFGDEMTRGERVVAYDKNYPGI